jgi:inhibitor of cysteine peptidase
LAGRRAVMRPRVVFLVLATALFAMSAGCALRKPNGAVVPRYEVVSEAEVRMGWGENGETAYLGAGDVLAVLLPSNPSTGYSWAVTRLDPNVIAEVGKPEYVPDPNPRGLVGRGGTSVFLFEAVGAGTTGLDLYYRRVWEGDRPPLRIYSIRVVVRAENER